MILPLLGAAAIGLALGLLGSGGSILTVPILHYLLGQPEKVAIAGSLFVVGSIALVGGLQGALHRIVDWRSVVFFGIPGMGGTYLGAWISRWIPGSLQMLLFVLVLFLAGFFMLRPQAAAVRGARERKLLHIGFEGLAVGVLTGLVGVGGGFLIVPALVLLGGLEMKFAVGTSLVIIALKSFSGFVKYLDVLAEKGYALDWEILLLFVAVGVIGSFLGSTASRRLDAQLLRRIFAVLLLLMGTAMSVALGREVLASRGEEAGVSAGEHPVP